MRCTAFFILLALICAMGSGCFWTEAAMKYGARGALEALDAKIPGLADTIEKNLGEKIDKGIESINVAAAEKIMGAAMHTTKWAIRKAGLDPMAFDDNADGELSFEEGNRGLRAAEESGKWPWYVKVLVGLGILGGGAGAGGGGFSVLKTINRYLEARSEKKTKAIIANGGGAHVTPPIEPPPPPANQ